MLSIPKTLAYVKPIWQNRRGPAALQLQGFVYNHSLSVGKQREMLFTCSNSNNSNSRESVNNNSKVHLTPIDRHFLSG